MNTRAFWLHKMNQLSAPVLSNLSHNTLKQNMAFEGDPSRRSYAHLEAFGRLLMGIAPWLEQKISAPAEKSLQKTYRNWARAGLQNAVNPTAPDFMNFTDGAQPLVDAAFLAFAIIRAKHQLCDLLDTQTKQNLITCLKAVRRIRASACNWILFSAMVEAALFVLCGEYDVMRVEYAIMQHEQWYKGDGIYGDGASYKWDFYNSYVIQPMYLAILDVFQGQHAVWDTLHADVLSRAQRYAEVLESMIARDGTYPPLGRSITYRAGAFQLLAMLAQEHRLPDSLSPAQVRCALTAVIHATMDPADTFDRDGWLKIGICGSQPEKGESYICTGSLYLCATVFLPLGLSENDPFWHNDDEPWTAQKVWGN